MFDSKKLDELVESLISVIPQSARQLGQDLEKNFRCVLQAGLAKLDLVTREEFEAQKGVLEKTRTKLNALEKKVAKLEQR